MAANTWKNACSEEGQSHVDGVFQGLREGDDPGLSPVVLPMLEYNFISAPGTYGGRYSIDANALSIYRSEGTRMQRTVVRGGWSLPWTAPSGEIYTLSASMRGDLYNTTRIGSSADSFRPTEDGAHARVIPQVDFNWRYPFIRRDGDIRTIVEPIVSLSAAPTLSNQNRFPNEDSRALEFDETNLFRASRFDGLDRFEGGQHVDYGFNTTILRDNGMRAGAFLGQSYRLRANRLPAIFRSRRSPVELCPGIRRPAQPGVCLCG